MHLRLSLGNRVLYSILDLLPKTQFVYSPLSIATAQKFDLKRLLYII